MRNFTFTETIKNYRERAGFVSSLFKTIKSTKWEKFEKKEVGMSQGMAINDINKNMKLIPERYFISGFEFQGDSLGLYGLKYKYKNAVVLSYWIDNGCENICVGINKIKRN